MKSNERPSDHESIEARAAAWIAQRDEGFSAHEEHAFAAWCDADPRHRAAVNRLTNTWKQLEELRTYRPTARTHPDPDLLAPSGAHATVRWLPWVTGLGLSAVALVAIFFGHFAWRSNNDSASRLYSTTGGGFERATLEDGSVVELNANSSVRVRYGAKDRRVTLDRGEAHFTVARNEQRPFWVDAGNVEVRAVGTAFDVRVAGQGIEVLVTAGVVKVAPNSSTLSTSGTADAPMLSAGWKAWVPSTGTFTPRVEKIQASLIKELLAWQSTRLTFVDMPLGEVVEQFNQRNDLQLGLADPELSKILVAGSFAADNVEAFVRLMTSNGDITSEAVNPRLILLHKVKKS